MKPFPPPEEAPTEAFHLPPEAELPTEALRYPPPRAPRRIAQVQGQTTRWRALVGLGASGLVVLGATIFLLSSSQQRAAEAPPPLPAAEPSAAVWIHAEGRLSSRPGSEVTLSSETGGTVLLLPVLEGSHVSEGQTLAVLSSSEERAALAEARGKLEEAQAEFRFKQSEQRRAKVLLSTGSVTISAAEQARRDEQAARARMRTAAAQVARLEAKVAKLTLTSPISGTLIGRYLAEGETAAPGAKLVTVADLTRTRIEAEVDEFDVGRLRLGAEVRLSAEAFPSQSWSGTVEEIPAHLTSRQLKPQDSSRTSDVRVLLVKIALNEPLPLKLGQKAYVAIEGGLKAPDVR